MAGYCRLKKDTLINYSLLEELTGKNYLDYFKDIISFLKAIPKKHSILEGLGEVLVDEKHKSFLKNSLLIELIANLEFRIKFDNK